MIHNEKFLIIGGDSRQSFMSDYLEKFGHEVSVYGLADKNRTCCRSLSDAIANNKNIILPLPVSKDGRYFTSTVPIKETIDEVVSLFNENHNVFAGMISSTMESKLKRNNCRVFDYFKREEVTVMNAVPTVQGILKAIIDNVDYTINSSRCAVFGYGKIGSLTADVLASLGADTVVCARKYSDLAKADIKGINSCLIKDFKNMAKDIDIIINTVPSVILNRDILSELRTDCLIIDVASAPYGTDFAVASELGLNAMLCLSLPGKVAPRTAGEIIAKGILNIIREEIYG
ncbi:MAG: dipicolinate synthase subunit DpsA [Clostridia bacterium]|nr:dipicolinate synthase subunit DpsA [Clostridia bacterium]